MSIILYLVPPETRQRSARLQSGIAIFSLTLIGLSVVAIIIIMFVGGAGVKKPDPAFALAYVFPMWGLPLGALGIIALFVIGAIDRRKHNTRQDR